MRAEGFNSSMGFGSRWRLYFHERFPLVLQAPVIAVFAWSVFVFGAAVRHQSGRPPWTGVGLAFAVVLLLFLQLRILDEFKDYEQDVRYRPYRPVPRGIVTLRELGWLGVAAAFVQVMASALLGTRTIVALMVVWAYAGLMAAEFFAPAWLKSRPLAYMASHMVVIPLIVAYLAMCSGAETTSAPLMWIAGMSYFSFCVFEIGRKIRSPADEREGVETYSALWGRRHAVAAWLVAMVAAGALAAFAARHVDALWFTTGVAVTIVFAATWAGLRFLADPRPKRGLWFFAMSGAWLVLMYLVLGVGAWMQLR